MHFHYVSADVIGFMNFTKLIRLYGNESTNVCVSFFHEGRDIDPYTDIHIVISEISDETTS